MSDEIFIHLGERVDIVSIGDIVEVSSNVVENFGLTEISTALDSFNLLFKDNPLSADM